MAEPLKNSFGPTVVDRIAQNLPVDRDAFVSDCLRVRAVEPHGPRATRRGRDA